MAKKSNCIVHGKPMYRIRAKIGTDAEGKAIYKSFYGDGALDAKKKRDEYLESMKPVIEDDTLGSLAAYYTYEVMPHENLAAGSIELYERQYRTKLATKPIASIHISKLRETDIQSQISSLLRDGVPSVPTYIKYLRKLFRYLSRNGYCANLADGLQAPKSETKIEGISTFNEQEVRMIIDTPNDLHFLFILALSSGLRLGEILALKYTDFADGCVSVSRQLNENYKVSASGNTWRQQIKDPKSESSRRTIPLPPATIDALAKHKQIHNEQMLRNGYRSDYVFTTDSGGLISKANFRRAWIRHLNNAGVPYRKFHSCRATYCTMLCRNGVPLETAAKLMGHSNLSITAKFYRMVDTDELRSAVDRIASLF